MNSRKKPPARATKWVVGGIVIVAIVASVRLMWFVMALFILGNIGDSQKSMIPFARAELHSRNRFQRQIAAQALGTIGPSAESCIPELLDALRNDSPAVAADSACALGEIIGRRPNRGRPVETEVVDALIKALDSSDGEVRRYAAYAISLIGPSAQLAVPKLTQRLNDSHMAYMAARALGAVGPSANKSIGPMTVLLSDPDWSVRLETVMALTQLSPLPRESVAAIRRCLDDKDARIRDAAKTAIASQRVE